MSPIASGVGLSVLAGALNGSFAAPTKYARHWEWENIWSVWAVAALLVFPWVLAFLTVPNLADVYRGGGYRHEIELLLVFGAGFGLAQVFFGLGIAALGFSLSFAIAIGISAALGSLVPLVTLEGDMVFTPKGETLLLGLAIVVAGIVVSAIAGKLKDDHTQERELRSTEKDMSFRMGLLMCILAGLGSPLNNFGLAYGKPLVERAAILGASPANETNVIWAPLLTASLVPYLIYCAHLWWKNRSFGLFAERGTAVNWLLGIVMAGLWMASLAAYGFAATSMGDLGLILGWPLFMSVIIIASNIWGFATGEWRGCGRKPIAVMLGAIALLVAGFCTLAYSANVTLPAPAY
jgi:L-rhamnose-H+ transport protein